MFYLAKKAAQLTALAALAVVTPIVSAAIDVSATVTELGEVKTAVLAIGVAIVAIAVGIKLYKWIKAAL